MNLNYLLVFGIILFLRFYGENNDLYTGLGLIVIFFIMRNITEGIVVNEEDSEENSHTVPNYTTEDITGFLSPLRNNPSYGKITPDELLNSGTIETIELNGNIDKYTIALNNAFGENIQGIYSYNIPSSSPPSYPPSSPESMDFLELISAIQYSRMDSFNNNNFYKSYIIGIINKLNEDSNLRDILIQSIDELDLEENFFRDLHYNIKVQDVDRGTKVDNVVMQLDDIFNRLFRIGTLKHAFDIRGFVELYIFFVISIFSYYDNFFGDYDPDPDSEPQNIMDKYSVFLDGIVIDTTAFIMMKCGPGGSGKSDRRCIDARRAVTDNQNSSASSETVLGPASPYNQNSLPSPEIIVASFLGESPDTKCTDYDCPTGKQLKSSPSPGQIDRGEVPEINCCEYTTLGTGGTDTNLKCTGYTCPTGTKLKSSPSPGQIDQGEVPKINCCENICASPLNYFADSSPECDCRPLSDDVGLFADEDRTGPPWFGGFFCAPGKWGWLYIFVPLGIMLLVFMCIWGGKKAYSSYKTRRSMEGQSSTGEDLQV